MAIGKKVEDIYKEQRKSELLLGKLLPANVLPSLKNNQVYQMLKGLKAFLKYRNYNNIWLNNMR